MKKGFVLVEKGEGYTHKGDAFGIHEVVEDSFTETLGECAQKLMAYENPLDKWSDMSIALCIHHAILFNESVYVGERVMSQGSIRFLNEEIDTEEKVDTQT